MIGHIDDNYCLRFGRGVVHVVIGHTEDNYCLRFHTGFML